VSSQPDVGAREDLWRALGTLPARQRAALVLRYYEDLSERETADVLGCSVAAVKSLVARGGEALRERIEGEDA
jgi:RNA polymerase sigma factor (sigma-70 family)